MPPIEVLRSIKVQGVRIHYVKGLVREKLHHY